MKNFRLALLGTALLATAALPAFAQPGPGAGPGAGPRGPAAMFDRIDADKDGRVAWQEGWSFVEARFAAADRDGDGALTVEEIEAARPFGGPRREGAEQRSERGHGHGHGHAHRRGQHTGMMFRALDADRDGKVTLAELRPAVEARFRAFDVNGDNVVARDELPARPHRGERGPRGQGAPAAPAAPATPAR